MQSAPDEQAGSQEAPAQAATQNATTPRNVVGVRFQRSGRVYYYDPAGKELQLEDRVVVDTKQGETIGRVVIAPAQIVSADLPETLEPVLRKAEPADLERWGNLKEREDRAAAKCKELVQKLELPMKVLKAESNLDGSHITVFFTAPDKVDFRQLARELAGAMRARVELRQVGARDASKSLGGIGKCGCTLCCSTFLTEFQPLSIKMAKEQNLSLDPTKISGACGRLLCCLRYENDIYHEMRQRCPAVGKPVTTPFGDGRIISTNVLKETVTVRTLNDAVVEVPVKDVALRQEVEEKKRKDNRPNEPPRGGQVQAKGAPPRQEAEERRRKDDRAKEQPEGNGAPA